MKRVALALLLAACSKSEPDPCREAYSHAAGLSAFGGNEYGGVTAIAWGMACDDLSKSDLACIDQAKTHREVEACEHASAAVAQRSEELMNVHEVDGSGDDPALVKFADAVCACKDKDPSCLVGVGKQREMIEKMLAAPIASNSPAIDRVRECLHAK